MNIGIIFLIISSYLIIGLCSLLLMVNKCVFYSPLQAPAMIILWPIYLTVYLLKKI